MIEQKEKVAPFIDLPIETIDLQAYKHCASYYFKGVGPFGSPFAFLSYGIKYKEMLDLAKFSTTFMDYIFDFLFSEITPAVQDRIIDFLAEAGLTAAEITWRIKMI